MSAQNDSPAPRVKWRWIDRLLARLAHLIQPFMNVVRVLWLTGWSTVLFAVGLIFFLINDQGMDILRRLVETRGWRGISGNFFFLLGVIAWGLSTWYCARLLLTRRFPLTDATFFDGTIWLRTWLPRLGGSLVAIIVAAGFVRVTLWGSAGTVAYLLIALYVVLGVLLFLVLWKRREMFSRVMQARAPEQVMDSLPGGSWNVLRVSFALSWGLLILFLIFPVSLPNVIGAPAILLFGTASWILFGSMVITYWPLVNGYPSLTLPLILFALAVSWFNDNHTIRSTQPAASAAARQTPASHFASWLAAPPEKPHSGEPYPVFVVAAAGGGIRASYWTVSVLGRIADESNGTWPDHLYAMSGVSGGSVGAALHAVLIAEETAGETGYVRRGQRSLRNDLLSPILAFFVFPDLVQRFVPFPVAFADRARAIELSIESSAADPEGAASDRFARRFLELWPQEAAYRVPALLLNTTVVETGQRAIVSNLQIDSTFSDSVDLLDSAKRTQDMPLSTAAHLSARFSYVSPAGTVRKPDGKVWGHIVDGGYFENSGAATAGELMQRMREVVLAVEREKKRKVALNLILIRNDPAASGVCAKGEVEAAQPTAHPGLNDLLSPVRALLSTRVARGRLAEKGAVDLVRRFHGGITSAQSPGCENGCVFEFGLGPSDIDPPLGWSLSAKSRESMDLQLTLHDEQFACIRGLLTGSGCTDVPVCEVRP